MVDLQPKPFTTASPVLVSFSFTDVSTGTGYQDYYLIQRQDSMQLQMMYPILCF